MLISFFSFRDPAYSKNVKLRSLWARSCFWLGYIYIKQSLLWLFLIGSPLLGRNVFLLSSTRVFHHPKRKWFEWNSRWRSIFKCIFCHFVPTVNTLLLLQCVGGPSLTLKLWCMTLLVARVVCAQGKNALFFSLVTAALRKCQIKVGMSVMFFRINAFKWSQRRQYTQLDSIKCVPVPLKCEPIANSARTWHSSTQTQEDCNCLTSVLCCGNAALSY